MQMPQGLSQMFDYKKFYCVLRRRVIFLLLPFRTHLVKQCLSSALAFNNEYSVLKGNQAKQGLGVYSFYVCETKTPVLREFRTHFVVFKVFKLGARQVG